MRTYEKDTASELIPSEKFRDYIVAGVDVGLTFVSQRFGDWAYHRREHTQGVVDRTKLIFQTIQNADQSYVSERKYLLAQLAAAFHDTVQHFDEVETPDGRTLMKRHSGENEKKSADEAVFFMRFANQNAKEEIFSEQDILEVKNAILITVPSWNVEHNTVSQINLTEESSTAARSVALADLGVTGLEPYLAIEEGDRVFREENLDIQRGILSFETLSEEQCHTYRERMLSWGERQVLFSEGRKALFEIEINGLSEAAKVALRDLFSSFDESIALQRECAAKRKAMTFREITDDMGY